VNRGVRASVASPPPAKPVLDRKSDNQFREQEPKAMKHERIIELKTQQFQKLRKIRDLLDTSELESRALSRRERAELDQLQADAEKLGNQIRAAGGEFNPRLAQGVPLGDDAGTADVLTREQRMSDWLRARGRDTLPSGLEELGDPERFSLGRMVRGACTGVWEGAELERRALSEGVLGQGGALVPTALSATLLDRVRNAAQVFNAGALTVPMETPTLNLARLGTGSSVAWKAENAAIAQSSMGFERVTLTAQALPILVTLSAELSEDLSPSAADLIEHEMAQALSLELDRAALRGSGVAPEPKGIRNQTGVTIQSLGANGASLLWDHLIDGATNVRNLNLEPNAMIAASRTWGALGKQKLSTGEYVPPPPILADVRRLTSNQVAVNLTQGTANNASEVYIGSFENLLIGIRTDLRLQVRVLSERFMDAMQYGLICWIRADVALAHPEAFDVVVGCLP